MSAGQELGEVRDGVSIQRPPGKAKVDRERVPPGVVREVWARAGGICAYPRCPVVLYRDPALRTRASFGEVAHNVAALPGGERGQLDRSRELSKDPENLVLLCPNHHSLVDEKGAAQRYPDSLLAEWKHRHEAAIRMAGTLSSGTAADALVLQGPIGGQPTALDPGSMPFAMLQVGLVLDQEPAVVSVDASHYAPKSVAYWHHAIACVRNEIKIRQTLWGRQRRPIAVFALADMPTLMALGFGASEKVPRNVV